MPANAVKKTSKASDIPKSAKAPPISEPPAAEKDKSGEIAGMLILGVAALALLFVFVNDSIINPVLTGLGGAYAFTLPVIIGWFGYLTIRYGRRERNARRVATISAMILIAFSILHLFFTTRIMRNIFIPGWINFIVYSYENAAGAGLLGALLAYPVYHSLSLGLWGGLIVLLALFAAGLVMLGAVSPREALDILAAKINSIRQREDGQKPPVTFVPSKRSRESRHNDLDDIQWDDKPAAAIIPNVSADKKRKSAAVIIPPLTSAPSQPEAEQPRADNTVKQRDFYMSAYDMEEEFGDGEPPEADADDNVPFYFKQPSAPLKERDLPKRVNAGKKRVKKKPDDDPLITEPGEIQGEFIKTAIDKYNYPPVDILSLAALTRVTNQSQRDQAKALKLEETLKSFGIAVRLSGIAHGPTVTRFELSPAPGVKVSRITALTDDIALNLEARSVRIEAPIPGKAAVGVEVPNDEAEIVSLREVLESNEARKHSSRLAVALGKDNSGKFIIADLAKMPHLLIAGATGAGKSVCINCIITSILYRASPEEVRLIMIDPKVVELSVYDGIPHLLIPVVTDPRKAAGALTWAVVEMKRRYDLFAERKVRDMKGYNMSCKPDEETLPQIVIIIDELADMMLVAPGEVEDSIMRLAQLARAAGIHLVIATQRPSVNVITGVIKANIPSRIAFTVASQVDSRTILDYGGAEKLLGRGDMLFAPSGTGKPQRVQGAWISDEEVKEVVRYIKQRHEVEYSEDLAEHIKNTPDAIEDADDAADDNFDDLLPQAIEIAIESGQASISMLQRRLRIGYARAGRLIDEMAARSFISQAEGSKPRDVLITREQFKLLNNK